MTDRKKTKILYVVHYGKTEIEFYCDKESGYPKKIIGDGGSNIHIHFIEYLLVQNFDITISTFLNNYQYQAFFDKSINIIFNYFWVPKLFSNLYKIIILSLASLFIYNKYDYIVSATDFLPDTLYCFLLKTINKKTKWIASYFLDIPAPWSKYSPYKGKIHLFIKGTIYWLAQRISLFLIRKKADYIFVTSNPDVKLFLNNKRDKSKIIVFQGGVDLAPSTEYLNKVKFGFEELKIYDACYLGRLHYQKGVLELIDIWKMVCQKIPNAKLIIVGNGPLEKEIKLKIKKFFLHNNITMVGYKEGQEKYQIFKKSKIMVHPAIYDSGGMSAAEGMAWLLPGVSFDLESLKSYYPKGMIKAPNGNLKLFSDNIIELLNNKRLYDKIAKEARDLIVNDWNFDKRSLFVYKQVFENQKNEN